MIRISDTIKKLLSENTFLQFGINNQLFNLTKLAKFLKPLVETRTKKTVTESALLMNLSRIARIKKKVLPQMKNFHIERITVHGNLSILSFVKTPHVHNKIHQFYGEIQKQNGYIAFTESQKEITLIVGSKCVENFMDMLEEKPVREYKSVSSIGVKFHENYVEFPGMLYFLIQQVTMQNINILELVSTYTEIIFYVDEKQSTLAFETLQSCFE